MPGLPGSGLRTWKEAGRCSLPLWPQGAGAEPPTPLAWSAELQKERGPGHAGPASGRLHPQLAHPAAGLRKGLFPERAGLGGPGQASQNPEPIP